VLKPPSGGDFKRLSDAAGALPAATREDLLEWPGTDTIRVWRIE